MPVKTLKIIWKKKLPPPHFSSPDIETRWYSFSIGIALSLKPSSTVSTLFSFINLKVYRQWKEEFKRER